MTGMCISSPFCSPIELVKMTLPASHRSSWCLAVHPCYPSRWKSGQSPAALTHFLTKLEMYPLILIRKSVSWWTFATRWRLRQCRTLTKHNSGKRTYDVKHQPLRFKASKGGKLEGAWSGPFSINRVLAKGLYKLRNEDGTMLKTSFNSSRLMIYYHLVQWHLLKSYM